MPKPSKFKKYYWENKGRLNRQALEYYYEHREVVTAYENPTKSKEISVEDMQKIVDANEKPIKELKDAKD